MAADRVVVVRLMREVRANQQMAVSRPSKEAAVVDLHKGVAVVSLSTEAAAVTNSVATATQQSHAPRKSRSTILLQHSLI
jgi:hypothetical protein